MRIGDIADAIQRGEVEFHDGIIIYAKHIYKRDPATDELIQLDIEIPSNPPPGHFKVKNLYVDSVTRKLVVEYDNTPV